jgi:hypothetical protein
MEWVGVEPTTSTMPTRIFYVAGGDSPVDDGGSTTSCPLMVGG